MVMILKGDEYRKKRNQIQTIKYKKAQVPETVKQYANDVEKYEREIEELNPKLDQLKL